MYIILLIFLIIYLLYILNNNKEFFRSVKKNKIKINKKTNKITKPYHNKSAYFKIKKLYNKTLHKFDFVPKMEFDDNKFEITEEYIPKKLTKKNRPEDYAEQLENIYNTFKKNNLYHNEMKSAHILLKNKKIFVIDFEFTDEKKIKWEHNKPLEYHLKKYK